LAVFGDKIREIRERKGVPLKVTAAQAGISESLLSQIERNKVSPAVDTLLKIIDALDIDFEYLFSDLKKKRQVNIVRKKERGRHTVDGVLYEQLSVTPGSREHGIEAYFIEIKMGQSSGSDEYGHQGRELGVIISGSGQFKIGNEVFDLDEGDSVSFDASVPHRLKNTGDSSLKTFWVITPPKMFM
jgi:transcriptional regulator with XRE-family HTH domain